MRLKTYLTEQIKPIYNKHIPHEARMDTKGIMQIGQKFFNLTKGAQEWTLAHELGHWFREQYVKLIDIMGWEPEDNFYILDRENSEEGFAEAFMYYLYDPNHLKKRYPEQYGRMAKWVGNKNKYIKIVKEIFKKVNSPEFRT